MKGHIRTLMCLSLLVLGTTCQDNPSFQDSVWQKINAGALLVDVRTQAEYNAGHLPGALLIPYTQIADSIGAIAPDKNRVIVLYCRSGRRSGIAEQTLIDLGYINAVNGGGYQSLLNARPKISHSKK
jgi:phage shock protein E